MGIQHTIALLGKINEILKTHNVQNWLNIFQDVQDRLTKAQVAGDTNQSQLVLKEIERLYGGMGSFNDLYITHLNGHTIAPENVNVVNAQLRMLQTELFLDLKKLQQPR